MATYKTGNSQLDTRLNYAAQTFGVTFSQTDIERWKADLSGTGTRNRSVDELWADILKYRVGEDKVRSLVQSWLGPAEQPGDLDRMTKELMSPGSGRGFRGLQQDIAKHRSTSNLATGKTGGTVTGGTTISKGTPSQEGTAKTGVGGGGSDPDTRLYILKGKDMKWHFDPQTGKWYVSYSMPNSARRMLFEAEPDQMDALFGKEMRPTSYQRVGLDKLTGGNTYTFGGNIAEVEGKGTWEGEIKRVTTLALDSGRLPAWASGDGEILDILFIAQSEGKSDEWMIEQISGTKSFKTRFGGAVQTLKTKGNLTTAEAVTAYLELEADLKTLERAYDKNDSRITPQIIEGLVNKGYSIREIEDSYKVFKRMEDNKDTLDAFNQVLVAQGKNPLTTQDMYAFLKGQASQDIYDTYEAASIRELAAKNGLGNLFSASDAVDAALESFGVMDNTQIEQGFQQAAQLLLRLRHEVNVGEYGLSAEDLVDISLGMTPRSGAKREEVLDGIDKAVGSARAYLENRAVSPYRQYQGGRVQQASLAGARVSG